MLKLLSAFQTHSFALEMHWRWRFVPNLRNYAISLLIQLDFSLFSAAESRVAKCLSVIVLKINSQSIFPVTLLIWLWKCLCLWLFVVKLRNSREIEMYLMTWNSSSITRHFTFTGRSREILSFPYSRKWKWPLTVNTKQTAWVIDWVW